jgi:polynucleotide 5'-triphosphatase
MESHIRFQSDMSLSQHRMYNMMLNEMVQKPPEVNNAVIAYRICWNDMLIFAKGGRVKYKHTRERDRFFKLSDGRKIRVTTDQQTGEVSL